MKKWIASASHSANILKPSFTKLGVGFNESDSDLSNHRFYWTQLFADSLTSVDTVSTADILKTSIATATVSKAVTGDATANTLNNSDYSVTIAGLAGNDSIVNNGTIASIAGGKDSDTITNTGSLVTILGDDGNDSIRGLDEHSRL